MVLNVVVVMELELKVVLMIVAVFVFLVVEVVAVEVGIFDVELKALFLLQQQKLYYVYANKKRICYGE